MLSIFRRHAADAATVAFAGVLLSVAVFESLGSSASKLALFAAVAIVAEALQRPDDELLPDALEGERFTLTAPIHFAVLLVAGPWVATAVAGWSVIAVGPFRGLAPMVMVRRAAAFGASALAGGAAFTLAGGSVGHLTLPEDLLPAAIAGLVYVTARTLFEGLATQRPALPDLLTAVAGVGLGIVLAFAALRELWLAIALVPLLLLVERLYGTRRRSPLRDGDGARDLREHRRRARPFDLRATPCVSPATCKTWRVGSACRASRCDVSGGRAGCTTWARWPSMPSSSPSRES